MNALAETLKCTGSWRGRYELILDPEQPADESSTTAQVASAIAGQFVRIEQQWDREGKLLEGLMLIGFAGDVATIHWADSFHTGRAVMTFTGVVEDGGAIDVRGTYPAPPGPDWGWRIRIEPGEGKLNILMWNIEPGGTEYPAVRAKYECA